MSNNDFIDNLKRQAEENPILAMGVAAALITSISKLMNASSSRMNAKAWDRETIRRTMKDSHKNK